VTFSNSGQNTNTTNKLAYSIFTLSSLVKVQNVDTQLIERSPLLMLVPKENKKTTLKLHYYRLIILPFPVTLEKLVVLQPLHPVQRL